MSQRPLFAAAAAAATLSSSSGFGFISPATFAAALSQHNPFLQQQHGPPPLIPGADFNSNFSCQLHQKARPFYQISNIFLTSYKIIKFTGTAGFKNLLLNLDAVGEEAAILAAAASSRLPPISFSAFRRPSSSYEADHSASS